MASVNVFSNFGSELVRPFYSRNIGINNGDVVPISFGAKITGNLMKNTRVGMMNVQTSKMDDILIENVEDLNIALSFVTAVPGVNMLDDTGIGTITDNDGDNAYKTASVIVTADSLPSCSITASDTQGIAPMTITLTSNLIGGNINKAPLLSLNNRRTCKPSK